MRSIFDDCDSQALLGNHHALFEATGTGPKNQLALHPLCSSRQAHFTRTIGDFIASKNTRRESVRASVHTATWRDCWVRTVHLRRAVRPDFQPVPVRCKVLPWLTVMEACMFRRSAWFSAGLEDAVDLLPCLQLLWETSFQELWHRDGRPPNPSAELEKKPTPTGPLGCSAGYLGNLINQSPWQPQDCWRGLPWVARTTYVQRLINELCSLLVDLTWSNWTWVTIFGPGGH